MLTHTNYDILHYQLIFLLLETSIIYLLLINNINRIKTIRTIVLNIFFIIK